MLTSETKRKLLTGGVFGLPMALVWMTGRMLGGPGAAEASETPELALAPMNFDDVSITAPTAAQVAAAERIALLDAGEFGPTPLHHRRQEDGTPVIIEDPEDSPVPEFKVSLIMASSAGNRAVIDGEVYVVGEELKDTGWTIVAIDARARSVSIRDPETDRVRTGKVNRPGLD